MQERAELEQEVTRLLQELSSMDALLDKERDERKTDRIRVAAAVIGVADKSISVAQIIEAAALQKDEMHRLQAELKACGQAAHTSLDAEKAQHREWRAQAIKDLAEALGLDASHDWTLTALIGKVRRERELAEGYQANLKQQRQAQRKYSEAPKLSRAALERSLIAEAIGWGRKPSSIDNLVWKVAQLKRDSKALQQVNSDARRKSEQLRERIAYEQERIAHHLAVLLFEALYGKEPKRLPGANRFDVPTLGELLDVVKGLASDKQTTAKDEPRFDKIEAQCDRRHNVTFNFKHPKTQAEAEAWLQKVECPYCAAIARAGGLWL